MHVCVRGHHRTAYFIINATYYSTLELLDCYYLLLPVLSSCIRSTKSRTSSKEAKALEQKCQKIKAVVPRNHPDR